MKLSIIFAIFLQITLISSEDPKGEQQNEVNPDGSFKFSYQNNDQGGHYHEASGKSAVKVRGRYGSRSPVNGRVDETVYTAGPRGYRARGPNIHRKQNLSQVPRRSIGSASDPLADPYDDPSYSFGFKTNAHSRREEQDSNGRVQGEYIYVDDVGEKHGVKYKAAANEGFEVENGVPDSPSAIRYNTPLYKSEPSARGRITFERGPGQQYKFLTSSPDQRRAESTGPDGITRGSYSYLDDKGVQRTVKYIAGAGIGYKVIESTVGPGTHVAANSDVPEYSVKAVSNEIAVADDGSNYNTGPSGPSGPSGPTGPGFISSTQSPFNPGYSPTPYPPTAFSSASYYPSSPRPFSRPDRPVFVSTPSSNGGIDRNYATPTQPTLPSGGPSPPSAPSGPTGEDTPDIIYGLLPPKEDTPYSHSQHYNPPTPSGPSQIYITPGPHSHTSQGVIHITPAPHHGHVSISPASHHSHNSINPSSPSPTVFYPTPTYLPTAEGPSQSHSPRPFVSPTQNPGNYHQHNQNNQHNQYPVEAIIKNTSNGWFYGVPPGSAVRAHIQNIDLVPSHDRALSPSEALQRDEERDNHSREINTRHHRHSHRRV